MSVSHAQTTLQLLQDVMLFRVNSGNPAVPVAQRQTAATQRSPMPSDSTEQSLSFGKPSGDRDGSNNVKISPLRPAVVEARQQDSQAASTSTAGPETAGMQQDESREQSAASPSPVSMQAQDQDVARQKHDLGTSALRQAKSDLSAAETSSSAPSLGHNDDRYTSAQVQPASGPSSAMTMGAQAGAVGPASSSQQHQILEQQGDSAATAGADSSRDAGVAVPAPLSDTDTRLGAAEEGIQRLPEADNSRLPDPGECHGSLQPAEVPCASVMFLAVHDHCMVLVGQCASAFLKGGLLTAGGSGSAQWQALDGLSTGQRAVTSKPPSASWT